LEEETGIPGENHRPTASHGHTISLNVVWSIEYLPDLTSSMVFKFVQ